MFMLYAVAAGILVGLALRGRLGALADVRVRWAPLAVVGLLAQVALFSPSVAAVVGAAGPAIYVGSTGAVLLVVLRNARMPGLPIVAAGAASNLAAILANGGWMPASPDALAAVGATVGSGYSNSAVRAEPALAALTDIFAMPAWLPFANIFSIGDVVISAGIAVAIVVQMRRGRRETPAVAASATASEAPVRRRTSLQGPNAAVPRGH